MAKILVIAEHLDGKLNSAVAKTVSAAVAIGGDIDVLVLAADPAWWEEQGSQRLMTFDLAADSTSWQKLLPYVSRKLSHGRLP